MSRPPQISATAPSTVSAHPGDHIVPSQVYRCEEGTTIWLHMERAGKCTARASTKRRGQVRAGSCMGGALDGAGNRTEGKICGCGDKHETSGSVRDGTVTGTVEASGPRGWREGGVTREKGSRTGRRGRRIREMAAHDQEGEAMTKGLQGCGGKRPEGRCIAGERTER